jgi:hypothetical protein
MLCRDLTVKTQPQADGKCSETSLRSRAAIRSTEALCIPHFMPMHYNVVIAIKQGMQVDLIWCDSLQRNGQQVLGIYAQYYHLLEQDMSRPKRLQPNRHYFSALTIRTHSPALLRQTKGTDCGIFTHLYHRTLSNWYGKTAGQTFTQGHIQELLRSLGKVTQETAHEYRRRLRIQMHTWWTETWEGPNLAFPPGVHQRNLQARRQRRRELQESLSDRPQEMTVSPATRTRQNHGMQMLLTDRSSRQ